MAWTDPRTWSNGEIVTQTMLNTDVRDNMRELWHEVNYTEFTSNVAISATTDATANSIVSAGAISFSAQPIIVEFQCCRIDKSAGSNIITLNLYDGSTDLGRIFSSGNGDVSMGVGPPVRRFTPSAASHTYSIRGWVSSGTATVLAGAGGAGTNMPGYIRILQRGS